MGLKTMSFYESLTTRIAKEAIKSIAEKFGLPGYTYGLDPDTEDVLIFFPLEYLNNMGEKDTFIVKVKEAWEKSDFVLKEEEILKGYTYLHVSFPAHFFRLGIA